MRRFGQEDFSAGMFSGVAPHLIPRHGVTQATNLLLTDTGSLARRGGCSYLNGQSLTNVEWVWDGYLIGGYRTLVIANNELRVLAADDSTSTVVSSIGAGPYRSSAALGGAVFISPGLLYAGSRKTAIYNTGTVATTNGSTTLTGTGTSWLANVDAGMLFKTAGPQIYIVESVASDTSLTLTQAWQGDTEAGEGYVMQPTFDSIAYGATFPSSPLYASAASRLFTVSGRKVKFSAGRDPDTGGLRFASFDALDYHEMPHGAEIIALAPLEDVLYVFTTQGIYAITNLNFDLTDAVGNVQQTVEQVSADLVAWGHRGIASWSGGLVVPMRDGIWLISRGSAPVKLSTSIEALVQARAAGTYRTGKATVYRSHYVLPILDENDAVTDMLVCRLDRPTTDQFNRTLWPWTVFSGQGGQMRSLANRTRADGQLLVGVSSTRVFGMAGMFKADGSLDADGVAPAFAARARSFETGPGNANTITGFRWRHEGTAATQAQIWDPADSYVLATDGTSTAGGEHHTRPTSPVKARYVTAEVRGTAAGTFTLRSLDFEVRESRKPR